jgi:hypothetical protein
MPPATPDGLQAGVGRHPLAAAYPRPYRQLYWYQLAHADIYSQAATTQPQVLCCGAQAQLGGEQRPSLSPSVMSPGR